MKSLINSLNQKIHHLRFGKILIKIKRYICSKDIFHRKLKIKNKGSLRINKWVMGKNNTLELGSNACLRKVALKIKGSNNRIVIGANTMIGENSKIILMGNNLELIIGEWCTLNHDDELLVQEDNSKIHIGSYCMFSHHINIRTSDAHPIYDIETNERTNPARNVFIGNHVWIGANVIVQKGSIIGNDCVVATYSVVNHKINPASNDELQHNTIYAGIPAKAVRRDIYWKSSFN